MSQLQKLCVEHYNGNLCTVSWRISLKSMKQESRKQKKEHEAKLERGDCAQCQTIPDNSRISYEHYGIHINLVINNLPGFCRR